MAGRADNIALAPRPARRRLGLRRVSRRRLLQAAAAALLVLLLIAVVPPFRRAAALALSKVVLTLASPLAPGIGNFKELPEASHILATDGSELTRLDGAQRREPVALKSLPPQVPHAVLAAEDANFYGHGGVDPTAVLRAVVRNAKGKTQGGSTITQQLAKINYTNSERTVFRKLREVQYAVRLEKKYSKDALLERYLNQVYFGDGAYGIAAAAETFFGVGPEQLTPAQAAMLAGKIKSPEGLDPRRDPGPVQARRDQVLRNMRKHGWLTSEQMDQAAAEPTAVTPEPPAQAATAKAPHFVEFVKREAARIDALGGSPESRGHQLFSGGYTIETTLDGPKYDAAVKAVQGGLPGPADPATAMVSVQPGDGAIRMLFGGLNFDRKFDVASQGRRQPGSSFKPYVYLAAVRDGISPRTQLSADSPQTLTYKGSRFTVNNYEGEGHGKSDIDNAMTHSINVVFSQLALATGLENVVTTAEGAGIPADVIGRDKNRPAIALGGLTKGLTPLEQAAGYATFAAKGVYAEPYSIVRIKDRSGHVVYTHEVKTRQAFGAKEVGVLNAALMSVVERGTGRAAAIGRPVAGKTGTTQNYGDAWFVGFVPQLATAVWVGYPDRLTPMTNVHGIKVAGGTFPARMFSSYMQQALADTPIRDIETATPESLSLQLLDRAPPVVLDSTT
ncbi:MAG TPA: transglycosylase domain-containing protein, partial [Acidimicrobiales bacterium]|nr:transglycosylase domain-containing protein [Acidimicrobiales bacterium]